MKPTPGVFVSLSAMSGLIVALLLAHGTARRVSDVATTTASNIAVKTIIVLKFVTIIVTCIDKGKRKAEYFLFIVQSIKRYQDEIIVDQMLYICY